MSEAEETFMMAAVEKLTVGCIRLGLQLHACPLAYMSYASKGPCLQKV